MKSRRKNQTRSKSKSRRGPMRRHVLHKRHVSPKRHLSPKRHGATSGARLRSRTKTRGRSRRAMRGGMSKNSNALPWIADAALVGAGAGGLLFGAHQTIKLRDALTKNTELRSKIEASAASLQLAEAEVQTAGTATQAQRDTLIEKENISKQLADAQARAVAAAQEAAENLRKAQAELARVRATAAAAATASTGEKALLEAQVTASTGEKALLEAQVTAKTREKALLEAQVTAKTRELETALQLQQEAQAGLLDQQRLTTATQQQQGQEQQLRTVAAQALQQAHDKASEEVRLLKRPIVILEYLSKRTALLVNITTKLSDGNKLNKGSLRQKTSEYNAAYTAFVNKYLSADELPAIIENLKDSRDFLHEFIREKDLNYNKRKHAFEEFHGRYGLEYERQIDELEILLKNAEREIDAIDFNLFIFYYTIKSKTDVDIQYIRDTASTNSGKTFFFRKLNEYLTDYPEPRGSSLFSLFQ